MTARDVQDLHEKLTRAGWAPTTSREVASARHWCDKGCYSQYISVDKCENPALQADIGKPRPLTALYFFDSKETTLPECIGSLTELTALALLRCQLLWCLPEDLGSLISLTTLSLAGCGGLLYLPESISKLT